MKTLTGLFLLVSTSLCFARPTLNFNLKSAIHSNLDRLNNAEDTGVNVNSLGLNFKYKKRLAKKFILVGLPLGLVDFAPSSDEQLRLLNLNHSLLGLYIPNSKNIFVSNFNLGFNRSFALDENGKLQPDQSFSAGLGLTYTRKFNKKLSIDLGVDGKISDFATEYDAINAPGEKNDNFKLTFKAAPKYVYNPHVTFSIPFEISSQLYKERRSLTENGNFGGLQVDQIRASKVSFDTAYRNKLLTLKSSLGVENQADLSRGGRSKSGLTASFDLKYYFKRLVLDSSFSYKMQDYESQLVDVQSLTNSNIVYLELLTLKNKLTLPKFLSTKHSLIFEHQFLKNNSNRIFDKNTNNVFSLGVNFII